MDTIKVLFTSEASATRGRNGYPESTDGVLRADLSVAQAIGGLGKAGITTPEYPFTTDYAASAGSAINFVGTLDKVNAAARRSSVWCRSNRATEAVSYWKL